MTTVTLAHVRQGLINTLTFDTSNIALVYKCITSLHVPSNGVAQRGNIVESHPSNGYYHTTIHKLALRAAHTPWLGSIFTFCLSIERHYQTRSKFNMYDSGFTVEKERSWRQDTVVLVGVVWWRENITGIGIGPCRVMLGNRFLHSSDERQPKTFPQAKATPCGGNSVRNGLFIPCFTSRLWWLNFDLFALGGTTTLAM